MIVDCNTLVFVWILLCSRSKSNEPTKDNHPPSVHSHRRSQPFLTTRRNQHEKEHPKCVHPPAARERVDKSGRGYTGQGEEPYGLKQDPWRRLQPIRPSGPPAMENYHRVTYTASSSGRNEGSRIRVRRQAQGLTYLNYTADGVEHKRVSADDCTCSTCERQTNRYTMEGSGDNIMYGKSTTATRASSASTPNCAVNDGNLLSCYKSSGDFGSMAPWLVVDLKYVYTIHTFTLRRAPDEEKGEKLMGNLDILLDGTSCKSFPRFGSPIKLNEMDNIECVSTNCQAVLITCERALTGRYLRFQKHRPPTQYIQYRYLMICELTLYACPQGYHGSFYTGHQCVACPEHCDYPCDNMLGCQQVVHNVGILKKASRSGTGTGSADYMIDGKPAKSSTCMQMDSHDPTQPLWWTVDLDAPYAVTHVNVSALQTSVSKQYLNDFYIMVTMKRTPVPRVQEDAHSQCFYQKEGLGAKVVQKLPCRDGSVVGQHVWVITGSSDRLGFCELEAYGYRVYFLPTQSRCRPTSKYLLCEGVCQESVCKSKVLQKCASSDECVQGSVCDFGLCKLNVGTACNKSDECKSGTSCGTSTKICKVDNGLSCEELTDLCGDGAVCDKLHRCGLGRGSECTEPSQCTSGASCHQRRCQCQQNVSVADGDNLCKPAPSRVGASCMSNADCDSGKCDTNGQKCACPQNRTLFAQDYSCRRPVGMPCDPRDPATVCNAGMVCDSKLCKLALGENCFGQEEHCTSGLVCDTTKICKLGVDENCTNNSGLCKSGTTCYGGTCKMVDGAICTENNACRSGLCSQRDNNTCRMEVGQPCDSDTAQFCPQGSACDNNRVCKLKIGEQCSNSSQCQGDAQCTARKGTSTNKCRRPVGRRCSQDEDCVLHSICDNRKQCRLAKLGSCQLSQSDMCLHGATCSEGQCMCNDTVTDPNTQRCDPVEGEVDGGCSGSSRSCRAQEASCGEQLRCQCNDGFVSEPHTLDCRLAPGSVCSDNETSSSLKCSSGTVCDDVGNICALGPMESCEGDRSGLCMFGTVCDSDFVCRLKVHESCVNIPDGCRLGTTCDLLNRCTYPAGSRCREDWQCGTGSGCNRTGWLCQCTEGVTQLDQGACVPVSGVVGSECEVGGSPCNDSSAECNPASGQCECTEGYSADHRSLSCAKSEGEACTEDSQCITGSICEPLAWTCRVEPGQRCEGQAEDWCVLGSVCDYDKVCRLKLNGNCSGDQFTFCKSGTFCDALGKCTVAVGDECDAETPCPAGAQCGRSSMCECNTQYATHHGAICQPRKGRYGAGCDLTCDIDFSRCVESICQCVERAVPDSKFNCVAATAGSWLGIGGLMTLVGVGVFMLIALMVILFVSMQSQHKKQKALVEAIRAERANSRLQLATLGQNVDRVLEADEEEESSTVHSTSAFSTSFYSDPASSAYQTGLTDPFDVHDHATEGSCVRSSETDPIYVGESTTDVVSSKFGSVYTGGNSKMEKATDFAAASSKFSSVYAGESSNEIVTIFDNSSIVDSVGQSTKTKKATSFDTQKTNSAIMKTKTEKTKTEKMTDFAASPKSDSVYVGNSTETEQATKSGTSPNMDSIIVGESSKTEQKS